jgi:hypothetical protein
VTAAGPRARLRAPRLRARVGMHDDIPGLDELSAAVLTADRGFVNCSTLVGLFAQKWSEITFPCGNLN